MQKDNSHQSQSQSQSVYNIKIHELGNAMVSLKRRLQTRVEQEPEGLRFDYLIDNLKYTPQSIHDLDKLVSLTDNFTQEVKVRVYYGKNSQNCISYLYKIERDITQPQENTFAGFGGLTAEDAIKKHTAQERQKWELEQATAIKSNLEKENTNLRADYKSLQIELALAEERIENLKKQLNAPIPNGTAMLGTIVEGIKGFMSGEFTLPQTPQGQQGGLGSIPAEVQEQLDTLRNLHQDFGDNMEVVWELLGELAPKQGYLQGLLEFVREFPEYTYSVVEHLRKQKEATVHTEAEEPKEETI
jgi:hypothetical protein